MGAAIGVKQGDLERALGLVDAGVDCIVIDVAHGHSTLCMDQVRLLKRELRNRPVDIIAGNVATGRGALDLMECGADAIKVQTFKVFAPCAEKTVKRLELDLVPFVRRGSSQDAEFLSCLQLWTSRPHCPSMTFPSLQTEESKRLETLPKVRVFF